MSNFIDPKVLQECDDVTTIDFKDADNQLSDDELGIGTSTRLLLCAELEDDIVEKRLTFSKAYVCFMRQQFQRS